MSEYERLKAQKDAILEGRREKAAIILWHRFAPGHHAEWESEPHKAEYREAAAAVLALAGN